MENIFLLQYWPDYLKIGKSFPLPYMYTMSCVITCIVQVSTFPTIAISASIISFHLEYCSSCDPPSQLCWLAEIINSQPVRCTRGKHWWNGAMTESNGVKLVWFRIAGKHFKRRFFSPMTHPEWSSSSRLHSWWNRLRINFYWHSMEHSAP